MSGLHCAILSLLTLPALADKPADAKDLMADKVLAEWEFISATPTAVDAIASVGADGVVAIAGKPVGYLATKVPYENHRLHFEWRWPVGAAKSSNGGVLVHIDSAPAGGTPWPVCFQCQLKLDRAGDLLPMATARFAEKTTSLPGKPPQLDRRGESSEKPPGEWNVGEIACDGAVIEVRINGVIQNRVSACEPAKGKVGFQLEGAPFELRNVWISK